VADGDPADLIPPADPPPGPRRPSPQLLTCEFCECRLTPTGDVLKLSDKAKAWRDTEGDREKLTKRLAELERQLEDAKTQLRVQHDHRGLELT
jgi:hypothetical protein